MATRSWRVDQQGWSVWRLSPDYLAASYRGGVVTRYDVQAPSEHPDRVELVGNRLTLCWGGQVVALELVDPPGPKLVRGRGVSAYVGGALGRTLDLSSLTWLDMRVEEICRAGRL